jgi:hypothetical protein
MHNIFYDTVVFRSMHMRIKGRLSNNTLLVRAYNCIKTRSFDMKRIAGR